MVSLTALKTVRQRSGIFLKQSNRDTEDCLYILKNDQNIKPVTFFISKLVGILNNCILNMTMQKGSKPANHPPKRVAL